jgi:hypothetical protein
MLFLHRSSDDDFGTLLGVTPVRLGRVALHLYLFWVGGRNIHLYYS